MRPIIILGLVSGLGMYEYLEAKRPPKETLSAEEAQALLPSLYLDVNAFIITDKDRTLFQQRKSESTYGEIVPASMEQLIAILELKEGDIFYDLGSGKGQVVIYIVLRTPLRKCVGIELATTRHSYAVEAKKRLASCGNAPDCVIEFYQGDFTQPSFNMDDATIVWMNSTCYPDNVMEVITQRLSKLRPGLRVITLKALPTPEKYHFKEIQELRLEMTWSQSVSTHIYRLEKPSQPMKKQH
jgi:SAM-dependent methyltransferase